jgi:hypothetical protein
MRFAKEAVKILQDPSCRSSGKNISGTPAGLVLVTAGGFALAAGCSFTDNRLVEKCQQQKHPNAYVVELLYRFSSGGVEIFRVGAADSVLTMVRQNEATPTITKTPKAIRSRKRERQNHTQSDTGNLDLVYRRIPHKSESVIIAPRTRALYVNQIWQAINKAKTWRQFASMLPGGEWLSLLDQMEGKPLGRERFNAEALPGYSDGDYPPWLQSELAQCLPPIVREEFSLKEDSVLNGTYWEIPADIEAPLIDRLRSLGYSVEQREDWFFY